MTKKLIIGGVLLLLALAVWLVSQRMVEKEITVPLLPSAEARANPLLAAERFMREMGQQVKTEKTMQALLKSPAARDKILMYGHRYPISEQRLDRLFNWIEGGGELIVDLSGLWDEDNKDLRSPLLERIGVRVAASETYGRETLPVHFREDDEEVDVSFSQEFTLIDDLDEATGYVASEQGNVLLQFAHGEGLITVINDLFFLSNREIEAHEHAYFLYLLAGTDQTLWLFYSLEASSLADLIWQHAQPLLLSLLLLALAWIRYGNQRFGPLLPSPVRARRNRAEHIAALGRFESQHDLLAERVQATQAQIEQRWLARHPHLAGMDEKQRAEWIAKHTGLDDKRIFQALYGEPPEPEQLSNQSAMLQRLWRQLW